MESDSSKNSPGCMGEQRSVSGAVSPEPDGCGRSYSNNGKFHSVAHK